MRTLNYTGGAFNYVISNNSGIFFLSWDSLKIKELTQNTLHNVIGTVLCSGDFMLSTWRIDGLAQYIFEIWKDYFLSGRYLLQLFINYYHTLCSCINSEGR